MNPGLKQYIYKVQSFKLKKKLKIKKIYIKNLRLCCISRQSSKPCRMNGIFYFHKDKNI